MNNKNYIVKNIERVKLQLKQLEQQLDKNQVSADLYNSLILEKAVLKKQLDDLNKNPIIESVKKIIPRRKKLICDYFN